ncbi:transglutaminase family protein [Erythrobacter sp.]|jgi:transglutaminase-like putative cysteine protease|uniref:transglutaminase family protein n=1 Tax=Erythrobacter sp. TaxID=1042 RepID=UPI002EA910B6|nr:transglutaminase family protein [Erythrobacter sp.]
MKFRVRHRSTLAYGTPVAKAQFNLLLTPRPFAHQTLLEHTLALDPEPQTRRALEGPYLVNTTRIQFTGELEKLAIASEFTIRNVAPPPPASGPPIAVVRSEALAQRDLSESSPAPFLFGSRIAALEKEIGAWGARSLTEESCIVAATGALGGALYREFAYDTRATTTRTPPAEAFAARAGVCQDFAHIMIIALRSAGIPSAYVSGYLLTRPPPGRAKLVGADAMHAWVAVWCGAALGWVHYDPTNDRFAGADHIAIGMGRDYADVAPITGTFIGASPQTLSSGVDVELVEDGAD